MAILDHGVRRGHPMQWLFYYCEPAPGSVGFPTSNGEVIHPAAHYLPRRPTRSRYRPALLTSAST